MTSPRPCGQPTWEGTPCRNQAGSCTANHPTAGTGPVMAMTAAAVPPPDPLAHRTPDGQTAARPDEIARRAPEMIAAGDSAAEAARQLGVTESDIHAALDAHRRNETASAARSDPDNYRRLTAPPGGFSESDVNGLKGQRIRASVDVGYGQTEPRFIEVSDVAGGNILYPAADQSPFPGVAGATTNLRKLPLASITAIAVRPSQS